jgi:hypothetical protein
MTAKLCDFCHKAHGMTASTASTEVVARLHSRDYDDSYASGEDDVLNRGGR